MPSRLAALAPMLRPGGKGVAAAKRLSGGASQELWAFEVLAGDEPPWTMVLRRAPEGASQRVEASAGLAVEARLLRLAAAAGVPAPALVLPLEPEHGLGEGFVMQFVPGETLGHRIATAPELRSARASLARQCGRVLARIHRIGVASLPPLRLAPAEQELAHYTALHRGHGCDRPVFEIALQWLKANAPPPAAPCLVHGDFRNGNLVVDEGGLRAVLDWELAHLGDPMEDLGWICVNSWRFGQPELPVGGFGRREDLFDGYREGGGTLDESRVRYWEVLGTLKWGVICEGRAFAWRSGAAHDVELAAVGRRASETEIDLLALLAPRSR